MRVCRCEEYPEGPHGHAVGDCDSPLHRERHPVLVAGRLHQPDGLRHRGYRILAQPQGQGEVKQHLRVRGPGHVRVQRRVHGKGQVTLHRAEPGQGAVVHEQPVPEPERMAVGLLNRRPGGGPDMAEEHRGLHSPGQLTQVLVIPCRLDAAENRGNIPLPRACRIPAKPEPVTVDRFRPQRRIQRLRNERMLRMQDQLRRPQRLPAVRQPTTHEVNLPDPAPLPAGHIRHYARATSRPGPVRDRGGAGSRDGSNPARDPWRSASGTTLPAGWHPCRPRW